MPELPEIETYLHAFRTRIVDSELRNIRIRSPSFLRSWDPPIGAAVGRRVVGLERIGKRIVWALEGELFLVLHLMVTGRFHRRPPAAPLPRKHAHAAFDFPTESFFVTEVGKQKRASLHLVNGRAALSEHDPGGLEVLSSSPEEFAQALRRENHTLKRVLTDPRILSGIGNAHSDEILHQARLSPVQLSRNLTDEELQRLHAATVRNLTEWTARLLSETGGDFPERITAFHDAMAVHGRYGQPCPGCGTAVQRIVYAGRETNYCPTCQTGGKLLADRALSRLLKKDWPRTVEEMEDHLRERRGQASSSGDDSSTSTNSSS